MPASPGCSVRSRSRSWRLGSFFGAMRYWMLGRSKLATKWRGSSSRRPGGSSPGGGAEGGGLAEPQPGRDLRVRGRGGGRGQRDPRHVGPALVQRGQREVVGPEVVPPLGDAVRL